FFWWGALGSILIFIPYFPRSKHIHLFMAPINLALRKERAGVLQPMDFENEETFGAAKLEEFTWPRLLDSYSCIMCNRCQDVCPATNTGKALSPAAILINERLELNRTFPSFAAGKESPRPLLDFALSEEAAWACTTCNACIEICPVGNEQMLHIMDVRRERVLAAAEFPNGLKNTFNHMERAGNPWGLPVEERLAWAKELPFPVLTVEQNPAADVLYWVGCAVAFDPRAQKIARSMAALLNAAGIQWAVLGKEEKCTGDPARRTGNEYLFAQMAAENVAVLDAIKPKVIVTTCPHCFHTIGNEYPQFGGNYVVKHHTQFIDELIRKGKLKLAANGAGAVTYHDPCYLGRHNGIFDQPRGLIQSTGAQLTEPARNRSNSFCCGAGGGQFWKDEEKGNERVSTNRYRELKQTGAKTVATGCPFCMRMITEETAKEEPETAMEVLDVAEIVARSLRK
ncbi:MAG TPA: (Fe-S)-binding protein, partial [Candidatus Acidoferrales bacterium]|nr:(Fe-S)-binding protein [Candidatus Acidoferrales bacterium]